MGRLKHVSDVSRLQCGRNYCSDVKVANLQYDEAVLSTGVDALVRNVHRVGDHAV